MGPIPIADTSEKYEAKKRGKIEGARQETFDAIDALKPYKGGNDLLWMLYKLTNIEKHRLLFTVGAQAAGIHLGQLVAAWAIPDKWPESARDVMESLDFIVLLTFAFCLFTLLLQGEETEQAPQLPAPLAQPLEQPCSHSQSVSGRFSTT